MIRHGRARVVAMLAAAVTLVGSTLAASVPPAAAEAVLTIEGPAQAEPGAYPEFEVRGDAVGGPDTIELTFEGPTTYRSRAQHVQEGPYRFSYYPGSVNEIGTYEVTARSQRNGESAGATLRVEEPALEFDAIELNRSSFYPLIEDGFQDTVTASYSTTERAVVSAEVISPRGQSLRSFGRRVYDPDEQFNPAQITWDGRRSNGELVKLGRYEVMVTAVAGDRETTIALPVRVVSKTVTRRTSERRRGTETTSRGRSSSNCYIRGTHYNGELDLDCWGLSNRDNARVTYAFKVPPNARDIRWGTKGKVQCCSDGYLRRRGERVSKRRFVVTVAVSYFRAFDVRRVWMSYKHTDKR